MGAAVGVVVFDAGAAVVAVAGDGVAFVIVLPGGLAGEIASGIIVAAPDLAVLIIDAENLTPAQFGEVTDGVRRILNALKD